MRKLKKLILFYSMKIKWKKINRHNSTWPGCFFDIDKVKIGKHTDGQINAVTYSCNNSNLIIGNYCSISCTSCFILGGEHAFNTISTYPFKEKIINGGLDTFTKGRIVVDDDVWIGEKALILSGVHIGQGAVVAAGAVVTKDVPPYAIVGGVPAKVIKYRFEPKMIEELLKIDYSKLTKEDIEKHIDDLYTELKDPRQLDWMPKKG